jgi:gluconate kinase
MKPTRKCPLFIVTGASGIGKSTLCERLFQNESDYVVLEGDILWDERFNTPETNYKAYRQLWLRLCAAISQSGKPVVLCGCVTPEQLEYLEERQLFTKIYYLALVADQQTIEHRMRVGRQISDEQWLSSSAHFNQWIIDHAAHTEPPMTLLDVSTLTLEEHTKMLHQWIMERLS